MEKVRDVASALIDSTVRVIARDGLDKASVRTISSDCQVPNPYIYQFFKDKDDLLISTFTREDTKLADEFSRVFFVCPQSDSGHGNQMPSHLVSPLEIHDGSSGIHSVLCPVLLFHVL